MAKPRGNARGNQALAAFKRSLKDLPRTLADKVAGDAAPALTRKTHEAYGQGRSVYGEKWPQGVDGNELTLRNTGTTAETLQFVKNGTIVRCRLGTRYAKYLIGKYGILPNGSLPAEWSKKLTELVHSAQVK